MEKEKRKEDKYRKAYHKELGRQRMPYPLWIAEHEPAFRRRYHGKLSVRTCRMETTNGTLLMQDKRDIILFVSSRGELSDNAVYDILKAFESKTHPDIVYGDEDVLNEKKRTDPWFKPEWSPDTFFSFFYFGGVAAIRRQAFLDIPWMECEDGEVNVYDFFLKATEKSQNIMHINSILFHRYEQPKLYGSEERFCPIKADALRRRGCRGNFVTDDGESFHVVYENSDAPLISVLIASKDNPEMLHVCLQSVFKHTNYSNFEVLVLDSGSNNRTRALVENLQEQFNFKYLYRKMDENYSTIYNLGAAHARGELVLLMRDNLEVTSPDWLERLAGEAALPHVGAVGAKMVEPYTGIIRDIGIVNTLAGPYKKLCGFTDAIDLYHGHNRVAYNMMAISGACFMLKKEDFLSVQGLCSDMGQYLYSVDLCFKLYERQRFQVIRNDVTFLFHPCKDSLFSQVPEDEKMRYIDERKLLYERHEQLKGVDPFYEAGVQSVRKEPGYTCNYLFDYENPKKFTKIHKRSKDLPKFEASGQLRAKIEKVECPQEGYRVEGYAYIAHEDNVFFERTVIIKSKKGELYEGTLFNRYRKDIAQSNHREKNIALCGFVIHLPKKTLMPGEYEIAIMMENKESGQLFYRQLDEKLFVR